MRRAALICLLLLLAQLNGGCGFPLEPPASLETPLAELERRLAEPGIGVSSWLELAEAIKCRGLRARLLRVGATPHALPLLDRAPLPRLRQGELILAFHQRGKSYRRYLVRPEGVAALRPLDAALVDDLVVAARDELEHGPLDGEGVRRQLARLGDVVLGGVGRALRQAGRVLILPDGLLRLIPFHALDLDGEPLGARVALSRAPCLALAGEHGTGAGVALVQPSYSGDPRHLSGAKDEVAWLARHYPRARVLQGARVTAESVAAELARPLALVHFAGHGLADLEPDAAPELLLGPDGSALKVDQATARPVRARLVILAACSAGQAARFRDGERRVAPVTYTDALLAAGAGAVVAASWTVKDRLSAQMMSGLHMALASHPPDAALRTARQKIRARLERPHPRFWAPYALYGGWR